jgi:hypothetical protein
VTLIPTTIWWSETPLIAVQVNQIPISSTLVHSFVDRALMFRRKNLSNHCNGLMDNLGLSINHFLDVENST